MTAIDTLTLIKLYEIAQRKAYHKKKLVWIEPYYLLCLFQRASNFVWAALSVPQPPTQRYSLYFRSRCMMGNLSLMELWIVGCLMKELSESVQQDKELLRAMMSEVNLEET